jgi:ankyrin repeat protein
VNSSSQVNLDISQNNLNPIIQTFLSFLSFEDEQKKTHHEHTPDWFGQGLCNGYSILMLRADLVGQIDEYLARLYRIAASHKVKLAQMATTYRNYQSNFQAAAKTYQHQLSQELLACDGNTEKEEAVRQKFFALTKAKALLGWNSYNIQSLEETLDIYVFIHALLTAQKPYIDLSYCSAMQQDVKNFSPMLSQHHIIEILERLSVDLVLHKPTSDKVSEASSEPLNLRTIEAHEEKLPPQLQRLRDAVYPKEKINQRLQYIANSKNKIHKLGFAYTKQELADSLPDIILEGDFAIVLSQTHDFYLSKQNGVYIFGESNHKSMITKVASDADATEKIIEYLYTIFSYATDYMPIGFLVVPTKEHPRKPSAEIVQNILAKRDDKFEIDKLARNNVTSLWMAAYVGCDDVVRLLLENQANPYVAETALDVLPAYESALRGYLSTVEAFAMFNFNFQLGNKNIASSYVAAKNWYHQDVMEIIDQNNEIRKINPLECATEYQKMVEVELKGANVDEKTAAHMLHADRDRVGEGIKNTKATRKMMLYSVARFFPTDQALVKFVCEYEATESEAAHYACIMLLMTPYPDGSSLKDFLIKTYSGSFSLMHISFLLNYLVERSYYDHAKLLLLLRPDAYVNAYNISEDGRTLLQHAVVANRCDFVKDLCSHGANVGMQDKAHNTVLSAACLLGRHEMAIFFLDNFKAQFSQKKLLKALSAVCKTPWLNAETRQRQVAVALRLLREITEEIPSFDFLGEIHGDYKGQRILAMAILHKLIDTAKTPAQVFNVIQKLDDLKASLSYLYERRSKIKVRHYLYHNHEVSPKWLQMIAYAQHKIINLLSAYAHLPVDLDDRIIAFLKIPTELKYGLFASTVSTPYSQYLDLQKPHDNFVRLPNRAASISS